MPNADSVREIAKNIREDCRRAEFCRTFVDVGQNQYAIAAFRDEPGDIPILIRSTMLESVNAAINRMFDRHSSQRHCFATIFHLLEVRETFEQLAVTGNAAELQTAQALWDALKNDERLGRLRALRNFRGAHNIPEKFTPELRPEFNELFGVLANATPIVDSLCAGTGITSVSIKLEAEIWHTRATDYWERLARGRPVSDGN